MIELKDELLAAPIDEWNHVPFTENHHKWWLQWYKMGDDGEFFFKGLIEMKSRIMSSITIVAAIAFIVLLLVAVVAYPMHIGEPSYYHIARVDCLLAASACGLSSILAAIASAHS